MPDLKSFLVIAATCCFVTVSGSAFAEEPATAGPRRVDAEPPAEPPAVEELPLVEVSPVRKNIGKALTAVGIVHMTTSGVFMSMMVFVLPGPYVGVIVGGPVHVEGTVLMAVGASLWTTGSQRVPRPAQAPAKPESVPKVSFGPGTAEMKWSF